MTEDTKEKTEPEPENEERNEAQKLIDDTNDAAERLEKANKESKALIDKQEAREVEARLSGKADAGKPQGEETPEEYAKKVLGNDL